MQTSTAAPPEQPDTPQDPAGERPLRRVVDRLAFELDREIIPAGDRAALRRHRPGEPPGPAFWKVAVHHLEPAGLLAAPSSPRRDDQERRWSVVLAALAELTGLHRRGFRLGRVLAESAVAEARVLRLLRARDEALAKIALTVVHQLASSRRNVDCLGIADLVLSDGYSPWDERARRFIAEDFYRSAHSERTNPKE
jgi:hypothetical protein